MAKVKQPAPGVTSVGKQLKTELLPHRMARATITPGDPMNRVLNNYAKKTPAALDTPSPSILVMSKRI